jgi:hypothetical protein
VGRGLAWSWSSAAWGALGALPACAVIAGGHASAGLALAVGTIPAGMAGIAQQRHRRLRPAIPGFGFALFVLAGAAIHDPAWLAVAGIAAAPVVAALLTAERPLGPLAFALLTPAVAIGLSFGSVAEAAGLSVAIACGTVSMIAISLAWPDGESPVPAPHAPPLTRAESIEWGLLLGAAAAVATLLGELRDVSHLGWAPAAALLVMRPQHDLLTLRGTGRVLSVLAGAAAAVAVAEVEPRTGVLAVLAFLAVVGAVGTRASRWYVTATGTTFLALSMILYGGNDQSVIETTFAARVGATLVGVGLAYLFGVVVADAISARRAEHGLTPAG